MRYSTEILAAVCIATNAITAVQAADCTEQQFYAALSSAPYLSANSAAKALNYTASVAGNCTACTTPCKDAEKAFLDSMKTIVAQLATAKPTCTFAGMYAVYDSYFKSPDAYTVMADGSDLKFADIITTMHKQCPYSGDGFEIVGNLCTTDDVQKAMNPFASSFGLLAFTFPSVGTACSVSEGICTSKATSLSLVHIYDHSLWM